MITNIARIALICIARNSAPDTDRMIDSITMSDADTERFAAMSRQPAEPFAKPVRGIACDTTLASEHVRQARNAATIRQ